METVNPPEDPEPLYIFRASRWNPDLGRVEYASEHGKRAFKIPVRDGWTPRGPADRQDARPKRPRKPRGRQAK